jgi:hypothetical protein
MGWAPKRWILRFVSIARVVLAVVAGLLLSLQLVSLAAPLVGEHHWRQADTYAVARHFFWGDGSFFYPRIDWFRDGQGVMGMELPLYPLVGSWLMHVFGEHPAVLRALAWIVAAAGAWMLARALGREQRHGVAAALIVFALSPMVLFETRQVIPDAPAFGLLLAAAALFWRFSEAPRRRTFVAALLVYTAAVLLKGPALVAGPAMWLLSFCKQPFAWRVALVRGLPFLAPVALYFAWGAWSAHLNETYNGGKLYFATTMSAEEIRRHLTETHSLSKTFLFMLPSYAIAWVTTPALFVGLVLALRRDSRRVAVAFGVWLLLGAVFAWLACGRIRHHWYYVLVLAPPLLYFAARGFAHLWRPFVSRERAGPPAPMDRLESAAWIVLVAAFFATLIVGGAWHSDVARIVAGQGVGDRAWFNATGAACALAAAALGAVLHRSLPRVPPFVVAALAVAAGSVAVARGAHDGVRVFMHHARFNEWRTYASDWGTLPAVIDEYAPRQEPILATGCNPFHLHAARRSGFTDGAGEVEARGAAFYRSKGVRLAVFAHHSDRRPKWLERSPKLAENARWELYCIAERGCPKGSAGTPPLAP